MFIKFVYYELIINFEYFFKFLQLVNALNNNTVLVFRNLNNLREIKEVHPLNILWMQSIEVVLKFETSKYFKDSHL